MTSRFWLRLTAVAFTSLAIGTGCAAERPPINQVQANALDKSFFVGQSLGDQSDNPEFYYRPSVVDVDYGASGAEMFTASGQTLARIKWEISENTLNARLTYEHILDSTLNGTPASPDVNSGQIAASFKIVSHFDIKRAYNPQTGEDQNLIQENTTDRPWYERQYMRVDWSQNLISDAYDLDTLAQLSIFSNGVTYDPVAYTATDPADPDAPVFDAQSGYFDVTNKVFAQPQMVDTPFGTFPSCFLSSDFSGGTSPNGNCDPTELKIRLSFRRVVDTDYEAVTWDGDRMNMFGLFTTGTLNPARLGYDRNYGVVDDKWYRLVSRHNIWLLSHAYDGNGQPYACYTDKSTPDGAEPTRDELQPDGLGGLQPGVDGTDDECQAAGVGSRCDRFRHQCTLPFRDRQTVTVPFYYAPDGDPTLFDSTAGALAEWDTAMRHTVQTARYAECLRTGGGVAHDGAIAACKEAYPPTEADALAAVPTIFTLCHSPVAASDLPACGALGTLARPGDLRYNMVNVIQKPQSTSPWGVMGDASDPITGEVVAASVNIWNAVTDVRTQIVIDTMRWYLGELSNADIASASYAKATVTQDYRRLGDQSLSTPLLSAEGVSARLAAMDSRLNDGSPALTPPATNGQGLQDWAEAAVRQKWGSSVLGNGNTGYNTRLTALRGTPTETSLITGPYVRLAGLDPSVPLDDGAIARASPLRGNFAQFWLDMNRERQHLIAQRGSCALEAPEPSSIGAWATLMNTKFPLTGSDPASVSARNEQWRQYIRRRFNAGVIIHEMGHSMGLRHQFTGSFDAINYHPQYWQLRSRDGQEKAPCTGPTSDGSSCIGPRWFDPVTPAERDGLIWRWQHTSVMDYPGDLSQDTLGLGAYDKAALRMAYADVADVVDDPEVRCTPQAGPGGGNANCTSKGSIYRNVLDGFGGLIGPLYQNGANSFVHYSQLNGQLDLVRNCQPVSTDPPAGWDASKDGVYSPAFDGHIVNGTSCEQVPIDYVAYRDLVPDANGGAYTQEPPIDQGVQRVYDDLHRVRHPYMFGSDEFADIGNLPVLRHDNGADAYEVASFLITDYEDRYLFESYRRNHSDFSVRTAFGRALERDNSKLMEMTKGTALLNEIFQGTGAFEQFATDDGLYKPIALAASLIFDHFARILTRPQSGAAFLDTAQSPLGSPVLRSQDQLLNSQKPTLLTVPDGSTGIGVDLLYGGRKVNNSLDQTKGYYSVDYTLNAGSYYDKTIAMDLITDSVDRFVSESRDDFSDGRYRNCSFATLFPDGLRRLITNLLTDDHDITGWRISSNAGTPDTVGRGGTPSHPFGFRAWWPKDAPATCWQSQNQLNCGEFPNTSPSNAGAPAESIALDPEAGFEVQKFIALYPMLNLPDSWKLNWVDMMRIYDIGTDANPNFTSSVTWIDPLSGETYVAQSFGTEVIDTETVQRSMGARVLQWMKLLTAKAYQMGKDKNGNDIALTYADNLSCPPGTSVCVGQPIVNDPTFAARVTAYKGLVDFMRQVVNDAGFPFASKRGLY